MGNREWVASAAASKAVAAWFDADPSRGLIGCTPSMVAGVAINAYQSASLSAVDHEPTIEETKLAGPCPDITIKWRENRPPYVEIRVGTQIMVAGWVHPTPDGLPKKRPRVGGLLTGYRTLSEGNLEYHADDETFIHDK